jgi:parallel beta-helix repeat protein
MSMNRSDLRALGVLFIAILIIHSPLLISSAFAANTPSTNGFSMAQDESEYRHSFPISISRTEDFIGLGFEGSGTQEDPFIIEDLNITALTGNCITISGVSEYFVIRNCFLKSTSYFYACIDLSNVNHSIIENCIIEGTGHGIETYICNGTVIRNCIVYGASHGLHLGYSDAIEVTECRIRTNSYGIQIDSSDNCNISSNYIYRNFDMGIDVGFTSSGNSFSGNKIGWNDFSNFFPHNAYDNGQGSIWETNQWDDYVPPGPYIIPGGPASIDASAQLLRDSTDPVVEPHEDIFFAEGTTGMELRWSTSDEFPEFYEIVFHNEDRIEELWLYDSIAFSLDDLPPGEHQFTLRLHDASGRVTDDSVYVTVFVIIFSDIGSPMLTFASLTSAVAVISVLVLFKIRQRR